MQALISIYRALADPSRVRILLLVRRMELSVGELAAVLGQSQPRVSRHIRILADAGLVRRVKEGAWVFVRLGAPAVCDPVLHGIDALSPAAGASDQARLADVRAERAAAADAWFAAHAADWDRERALHIAESDIEAAIAAVLARDESGDLGELVDVGTGTGRMIELLGPQARAALGIDRSPEMLRLARGRIEASGLTNAEVRRGDMYALPRDDGSADTVVLHQVLHFADDPAAVIAEAARVLAPVADCWSSISCRTAARNCARRNAMSDWVSPTPRSSAGWQRRGWRLRWQHNCRQPTRRTIARSA